MVGAARSLSLRHLVPHQRMGRLPAGAAECYTPRPRQGQWADQRRRELINCSLRQLCAVLVRKSCSFNRSLAMSHVRLQLVIDEHNRLFTKLLDHYLKK